MNMIFIHTNLNEVHLIPLTYPDANVSQRTLYPKHQVV